MENILKRSNCDIVINHMQNHVQDHCNAVLNSVGNNDVVFNHLQQHFQSHYNAVFNSVEGQVISIVSTSITITY